MSAEGYGLRECPFCHGDAFMQKSFCVSKTVEGKEKVEWEDFFVSHECKVLGEVRTRPFNSPENAAKAWNGEIAFAPNRG